MTNCKHRWEHHAHFSLDRGAVYARLCTQCYRRESTNREAWETACEAAVRADKPKPLHPPHDGGPI